MDLLNLNDPILKTFKQIPEFLYEIKGLKPIHRELYAILLGYWKYAQRKGNDFITAPYATLCELLGVHTQALWQAIDTLIEYKLILRENNKGFKTKYKILAYKSEEIINDIDPDNTIDNHFENQNTTILKIKAPHFENQNTTILKIKTPHFENQSTILLDNILDKELDNRLDNILCPELSKKSTEHENENSLSKDIFSSGKKENEDKNTEEILYRLPTNKFNSLNETFNVTASYFLSKQPIYADLDLNKEFNLMRVWLEDNPRRRKTLQGMKSFITNWLNRSQSKGQIYEHKSNSKELKLKYTPLSSLGINDRSNRDRINAEINQSIRSIAGTDPVRN